MARTVLAPTAITVAGITPSLSAANAQGHYITNNGNMFVRVKNTNGSDITVTVQTPATVGGLAIAEVTVTVAATTGDKLIGPFPPAIFNQTDGTVYVDFSAVTDVTCAAFTLG